MANRYLRDRAMRRMDRRHGHDYARHGGRNDYRGGSYQVNGYYDGRNAYGSAGGYVSSDRAYQSSNNRAGMSNSDYRYDGHFYGEMPFDYNQQYHNDYAGGYDYAEQDEEKKWMEDLDRWASKLKRKNKFNIDEKQIVEMAKRSNASMKDYNEKEYYVTFLMMVSDYPRVSNDPSHYAEMAKSFLEDDDSELVGSEKLCKYYYTIIKGEDD